MSSRRAIAGWRTPGRASFPHENLTADGYERTSPVTHVRAERLRSVRHDRQRVGMDQRLVRFAAQGRRAQGLLHSPQSARRPACRTATTVVSPTSRFRARCSRAVRSCARRTTAADIGPRPDTRNRSTLQPVTSGSDAWCGPPERQGIRTAAPLRAPDRNLSSATFASPSANVSTCVLIGTRAASSKNSSPSRRVRFATERTARSPHSSS